MHPPPSLLGTGDQPGLSPLVAAPGRPEVAPPAGGSAFTLLSTEVFAAELIAALGRATGEVAFQLMTFDGDASGLAVADALCGAAGRGVRVRVLVDCFAHRFVSDQPVHRPEVADEYRRTVAMYSQLARAGASVRFTNPNGPLNLFALARNHKKLYVIDDAVYLGGVNVSDHNFGWHDVMVRIDDPAIRRAVLDDFDATFAGRRPARRSLLLAPKQADPRRPGLVTDAALRATFDQLLAQARRRVVIASPYALDRRVAGRLEARPDLDRLLLIAERNNFWCLELITPYLAARMARSGVALASFGRFSHAKFLLVDDNALLIGSSNFGRHSLTCNQEIGVVIRDRAFIAHFERCLLGALSPLDPSGSRRRRLAGWAASAIIDVSLMAYARVIAPHVPPLAPASGRGRPSAPVRPEPTAKV